MTLGTDGGSGSRQWPLFLQGFSSPAVTHVPSQRAEADTQQVGLSLRQTWGRGLNAVLCSLGVDHESCSIKQHDLPWLEPPQRSPRGASGGETSSDTVMVAATWPTLQNLEPGASAPITLRFSRRMHRRCTHTPGTGYPGGGLVKDPARFWQVHRGAEILPKIREDLGSAKTSSHPSLLCGSSSPLGTYNEFTTSGQNPTVT